MQFSLQYMHYDSSLKVELYSETSNTPQCYWDCFLVAFQKCDVNN